MTAVWFVWLESGYMLVLLLVVVRQSWNVIDIGSSIYCVKLVRISSCSGPYFPAFELNIDRYSVSICIQSECGKIPEKLRIRTLFTKWLLAEIPNLPQENHRSIWYLVLLKRCLYGLVAILSLLVVLLFCLFRWW